MTKVFTLDGKVINVGEWDYQVYQVEVIGNPFPGPMEPPADWDCQVTLENVTGNPLPTGAQEIDASIVETAKGRLVLTTDWHSLREDAYPSLKDQLDAMWKGGEAAQEMATLVQSIKDRYPKTEAS